MQDKSKRIREICKTIFLLLLIISVFCTGFIIRECWEFFTTLGIPRVQSDYPIRRSIEEKIGPLPPSVTKLYYATNFFVDADCFIAFSLDTNMFDKMMKNYIGKTRESFEHCTSLHKRLKKCGPSEWELKYKDPNWDLILETDTLVYEEEYRTILYSPSKSRVYICLWGH